MQVHENSRSALSGFNSRRLHHFSNLIPFLAIGAFAGLRHAEIARLDRSQVRLDEGFIEVKASNAKTASRRLVPVTENQKAWLVPHHQLSGKICPYANMPKQLLWLAEVVEEKWKQEKPPGGFTWKHNALRHSFISYRVAPRMNGQFTISSHIPDKLLGNRLTIDAMKLLRHIITIVCLVATFIVNAGGQLITKAKSVVNQPTNAELQLLQGTWEGVLLGDEAHQKITITITGDSLHFHRDTNFWFETTITLPAGTNPKQLHATIKDGASSVGQVVVAIFKIEDGRLTLATGNGDGEAPKRFEATGDNRLNRYELRKVQSQKENTQPPKTK